MRVAGHGCKLSSKFALFDPSASVCLSFFCEKTPPNIEFCFKFHSGHIPGSHTKNIYSVPNAVSMSQNLGDGLPQSICFSCSCNWFQRARAHPSHRRHTSGLNAFAIGKLADSLANKNMNRNHNHTTYQPTHQFREFPIFWGPSNFFPPIVVEGLYNLSVGGGAIQNSGVLENH